MPRRLLLNIDQAAERLTTSPSTVRRLVAARTLTFYKIGRSVRLDAADLDAFIERGRVDPCEVELFVNTGRARRR